MAVIILAGRKGPVCYVKILLFSRDISPGTSTPADTICCVDEGKQADHQVLVGYLTSPTLALAGVAALTAMHHKYQPITGHGVAHPHLRHGRDFGHSGCGMLSLPYPGDHLPRHREAPSLGRRGIATQEAPRLLTHHHHPPARRQLYPLHLLTAAGFPQRCSERPASFRRLGQGRREAAAFYKLRYGLPPPPRFDEWHAFAVMYHSPIIDILDQIDIDLKSFWGLAPAELRARTSHLLALTGQGFGGLRIRSGGVELSPNTPPTHRG